MTSAVRNELRRGRQQQEEEPVDVDAPPLQFASPGSALRWAMECIERSGSLNKPNILYRPPRYREESGNGPTREEIEDEAYTITSLVRQQERAYAAMLFAVLQGDDDGDRWNEVLDLVVMEVQKRIDTSLSRGQLRTLALVALQRIRSESLGLKPVPQRMYADAIGVRRQSAGERKWKQPIHAIEDVVREWRKQGKNDLREAMEARGIVV